MGSDVLFWVEDMVEGRVESKVLFRVVGLVDGMVGKVGKTVSLKFSVGQTSSSKTSDSSGYVSLTSERRFNQVVVADRRPLLLLSARPVLWQSRSLVSSTNTPGSLTCSPTIIVKVRE